MMPGDLKMSEAAQVHAALESAAHPAGEGDRSGEGEAGGGFGEGGE